jgi:site-specific DNA recombinase
MARKRRVSNVVDGKEVLRVLGYVRVSTEEQAKEGSSLKLQPEKIRSYCDLYGLDLARIECDEGISAKTLDRPALATVLDDLERGRVDGVVIYKLDRLTRSLRDWSDLIDRFFSERAGRRLFSVNDSIDTRTAAGRLVLNVMMTVSQWEREVIAERTADAMQGKIRRGERAARRRFGYDLDPTELHPETGKPFKMVPNPREQEAIAFMAQWLKQGKSYREMVALLTELGIETKDEGSIWRPGAIHRILTRPIP